MRGAASAALLLAIVFAAPLAHADEEACKVGLGRGWPPATENYGSAVEQMVAGPVRAPLSFTLLPAGVSVERGLALLPGATETADWTLRYVEADCHVYIYYMDIRTYGLYETKYYWKSQEEFKVKYIKARIAEVTSDGNKLIVKGEDTLVKRPITIPFDMVVHAIGMDPNVDNKSIAGVFGVALQEHGHIGKGNAYGALGETSRPGVFVAGAATGPETIDDSIAQGKAAAMAAFALVNRKTTVAA